MKRRLSFCLLAGVVMTLLLASLAALSMRFLTHASVPAPFFIYALLPGFVAGARIGHGLSGLAFVLANSVVYALLAFCISAVARRLRSATS